MRLRTNMRWLLCATTLIISTCFPWISLAQNEKPKETDSSAHPEKPQTFYRLDFTLKEIEGNKVVNSRSYSMMIVTGRGAAPTSIRAGGRVPVEIAPFAGSAKWQMMDLGVNIDCRFAESPDPARVSFDVTADISTLPTGIENPQGAPPGFRQTKWTGRAVIPIRKPTVIFSSDDIASKGKMQLELTATPIP